MKVSNFGGGLDTSSKLKSAHVPRVTFWCDTVFLLGKQWPRLTKHLSLSWFPLKSHCIIAYWRPSTSEAHAVQDQAWFVALVSVLLRCVCFEECDAWCSWRSSNIPPSLVNVCLCIVFETLFISGIHGDGVKIHQAYVAFVTTTTCFSSTILCEFNYWCHRWCCSIMLWQKYNELLYQFKWSRFIPLLDVVQCWSRRRMQLCICSWGGHTNL